MKFPFKIFTALLAFGFFHSPMAFAKSGDLSLSDANVYFSSPIFLEGSTVRIRATVQNNADDDLLGSVRFQTQDGVIGADQPISALAGKTDDVFMDFTPTKTGYYEITIIVIPWDASGDDSSNNSITKTIYVELDTDRDGKSNTVDEDIDGDGVLNEEDAFVLLASESKDTDGDGTGNNEDLDDDNDSFEDNLDALPENPLYSKDLDADGIADEVDNDVDGDGLNNKEEIQLASDPLDEDSDEDNVNDKNDAFPLDSNESIDTDKDGQGDNSDEDIDGDGTLNSADKNPYDRAPTAKTGENSYFTNLDVELAFDASESTDNEGSITKYIWQFGDETIEGKEVKKSFDSKGLQVATLTVIDESGQESTTEVKIRIIDYKFVFMAILFAIMLISIAFYFIYRYNAAALNQKSKK